VAEITALTAGLGLPWTLKWVFAPVLDLARGPRWGYRHWMLVMQAVMVATLLPIAWLDLQREFEVVYAFCLLHACAAALQDVSIDALAIGSVPPGERGTINGWMQAGMLLGRAAFGGLAIRFAAAWGLDAVVGALAGLVAAIGVGGFLATRGTGARTERALPAREEFARIRRALLRRRTFWGLVFAGLAGAGFEAVGGVASVYLVDAGFDAATRGNFLAFGSVPAMILGSLGGGFAADRWGTRRAAATFLVMLAGTILVVAFAAAEGGAGALVAFAAFYVGVGLFTAASYALFMDLTDPGAAATQFTLFMAMTNGCEVWSIAAVGPLIGGFGYPVAFSVMAVVSLFALPVTGLRPLRAEVRQEDV